MALGCSLTAISCGHSTETAPNAGSEGDGRSVVDAGSEGDGRSVVDAGSEGDGRSVVDAGSEGDGAVDSGQVACAAERATLVAALEPAGRLIDFTLLLRCASGGHFQYSSGSSTPATDYESASTSKWVTATIILRLVDKRKLELDTHPQEHIPFWTNDPAQHLSHITLRQLLSFTSGLHETHPCLDLPNRDFAQCTEAVFNRNLDAPNEPGTTFHYNSAHLQVAGLMAIRAAEVQSWGELFAEFQAETGLFPSGRYDLPSARNPRLAGGMHWRGEEYLDFLEAFSRGELLEPSTQEVATSDHVGDLEIVASPVAVLGEEWHYGQGLWLECPSVSFDCPSVERISSPGAWGAYPWIDVSHSCMGLLARQGGGTYPFQHSKQLLDGLETELHVWMSCVEP
jgi:hypothetical protein